MNLFFVFFVPFVDKLLFYLVNICVRMYQQ
jgi:hypothetical protein